MPTGTLHRPGRRGLASRFPQREYGTVLNADDGVAYDGRGAGHQVGGFHPFGVGHVRGQRELTHFLHRFRRHRVFRFHRNLEVGWTELPLQG